MARKRGFLIFPETTSANVLKSLEQFVKGWDGTASGYEFEPFHLHGNKKWHLQCVLSVWPQQLVHAVPEVKTWKPEISEDFATSSLYNLDFYRTCIEVSWKPSTKGNLKLGQPTIPKFICLHCCIENV